MIATDNWKSERIYFPLEFATDIDFKGFEDLRFAPNWSDTTNENFWTYVFVWYVEKGNELKESKLTSYINSYYDGLMTINLSNKENSTKTNKLDNTISLFIKTNDGFVGKIKMYDAFFSKDYIILNVKVRDTFCSETNKNIVLFEISKKPFNHNVWQLFNLVKLKVTCN